MESKDFLNINWLTESKTTRFFLPFVSFALVLLANYYVFMVVPNERVMGAVQRILYFHVGSAMAAYLMIGVLFVASTVYLVTRRDNWDALATSAGGVAFLFSSIVLASGMIWGHSAWNTWWRWEPRLVSFLVLWLVLLSYLVLRSFSEGEVRQKNFSSVIGIIAAVNVPIVIFSIKLLDHSQQLHPEVVANQGLRDTRFVYGMVFGNFAVLSVSLWLLAAKFRTVLLERELRALKIEFGN